MFKKNKLLINKNVLLFSQQLRPLRGQTSNNKLIKSIDNNNSINRENERNNDYLGIFDSNNRLMSGLYETNISKETVFNKYKQILDKYKAKMNDEKAVVTTFGRVRLDSENRPKIHGQFETSNKRLKYDFKQFEKDINQQNNNKNKLNTNTSKTSELNLIDEQYFSEDMCQTNINRETHKTTESVENESNFIDKQYFDQEFSQTISGKSIDQSIKEDNSKSNFIDNQYFSQECSQTNTDTDSQTIENDNNFIDEQYFKFDEQNIDPNFVPLMKHKINFKFSKEFENLRKDSEYNQRLSGHMNVKPFERNTNFGNQSFNTNESPLKTELFDNKYEIDYDFLQKQREIENESQPECEKVKEKSNYEKMIEIKLEKEENIKLEPKPKTGAQYLEDIRSGNVSPHYKKHFTQDIKQFGSEMNLKAEKLDSKGFRILKSQVYDYNKFTNEDIVELLWNRILFNDADIVAIDKPYGMAIHGKETSKSCPQLTEFLPQLSKRLRCEQLYTVHRLDRDTTGILLLTKTQSKADFMNQLFLDHKISKKYLCITRGVPDNSEGIIDIPIEVGKCEGKERMVLRPEVLEEYRSLVRSSKKAKRAVTHYKVVSESQNAALLQVTPETGIRHQIRVHLGLGLRCPVLGDHKYSQIDKIVPQKLTNDMLLALNVRQSKVRYIPMHLHSREWCIPEAGTEGRNIFINAPLPSHFKKNMSSLKLWL